MRRKIQFAVALLSIFLLCKIGMGANDESKSEPYNFFREYVGLNAEQIQSINNGKAFAKIIDAGSGSISSFSALCTLTRLPRNTSNSHLTLTLCANSPAISRFESSAILPCFQIWMASRSKRKT